MCEYDDALNSYDQSANVARFGMKKIGVALGALGVLMATAFIPLPEAQANGCIYANFGGGNGTAGDPLQVATPAHLNELQGDSNCWGYEFLQTADISMSGATWSTGIGGNFTGVYDGGGHSISNLVITKTGSYVGLFSRLTSTGTVRNLSFGGTVTGGSYVGGLVGDNQGAIETSFVSSSAVVTSTSNYPGGLVGLNTGTISNSFSAAAVSSPSYGAGLVANLNAGSITNSYAVGLVTGTQKRGLVATVGTGTESDSFWDTESSGVATSALGTSKSTTQMQTLSTFAAWSISDSWSLSNTWGLCSRVNSGYPYLTAFFTSDPCGDSPSPSSSSSEPAVVELTLSPADGTVCNSPGVSGAVGTWLYLPSVSDCMPPATTPNSLLLGWATTPDFPLAIAQRQVDNGWGAYEIFDGEGRITAVFFRAGGAAFVISAGEIYPIWSQ